MAFEDLLHLPAEVTFDFEDQTANPPILIVGSIGENLLGEGVHAAAVLPRANGSENGDAGEQSRSGIVSQ